MSNKNFFVEDEATEVLNEVIKSKHDNFFGHFEAGDWARPNAKSHKSLQEAVALDELKEQYNYENSISINVPESKKQVALKGDGLEL
jgi:hypothetical protein